MDHLDALRTFPTRVGSHTGSLDGPHSFADTGRKRASLVRALARARGAFSNSWRDPRGWKPKFGVRSVTAGATRTT